MKAKRRIFVGQLCDKSNNNAQVLNTRALLARFRIPDVEWIAPYYEEPDSALIGRKNIRLVKLCRTRLWQFHKFLLYQLRVDAIFYPNAYWFDDLALQLRKFTARRVKVISTLEGLVGNEERERRLSEWAGHTVHCQQVPDSRLRRFDRVHGEADQIVAISPFLAKMGRKLYGDNFSVISLGIDTSVFYPEETKKPDRFRIIGAGRLYANKRPGLFLDLAESFPQADFVWFGDGESREQLLNSIKQRRLENLSFPGAILNNRLSDEMRAADFFILPSLAEGSPKVVQEAAPAAYLLLFMDIMSRRRWLTDKMDMLYGVMMSCFLG